MVGDSEFEERDCGEPNCRELDCDHLDDARLLDLFQDQQDQRAFAELVRRHGPMVMATVRRTLHRVHDVEDACQATFFALAKSARKIRHKAAVAGWLHRTAYVCAVQIRRTLIRQERVFENMADHRNAIDSETDHPAQEIARGELSEILDLELSRLPTQFQTPVVLCDLEGLTHREAAQRLGIASSTLQDHLAKGRRLLRDRFVRRGVTLSLGALAASQAQHVLSEERISAISSKALLFALGKSASEICVSSLAFQTANKVTATMMKTRTLTLCCAALTLIMLFGPISALTGIGPAAGWLRADDLLFDDFTSPNPTSLNREPIRWLPDPGRLSIVDGSLHIAGAGQFSRAVTSGFDHADVSVRTLFRDGHNASPWIQARFRKNLQPADTGYFAGLLTDGTAFIGITGGNPREIVSVPTDVDPTRESVLLQFDALGDELTLYAWRADEPFPAEPTVSFDGATLLHSGEIALGIGAGNQSLAHSGNFDFVRVAPYSIPEPSTALLAGAGLAGLLYVSRRAHLPQCFS